MNEELLKKVRIQRPGYYPEQCFRLVQYIMEEHPQAHTGSRVEIVNHPSVIVQRNWHNSPGSYTPPKLKDKPGLINAAKRLLSPYIGDMNAGRTIELPDTPPTVTEEIHLREIGYREFDGIVSIRIAYDPTDDIFYIY